MVSDNEVHADPAGRLGRSECTNPGVNGDDETNAGFSGALYYVVLHAVTVFDSVRHMELCNTAAELDRCFQDHDGSGAINVIVAVDKDVLLMSDRGLQAFDSGLHAEHGVRRVQVRKLW